MSDTPRTDAAWYASEGGAGCEPLLKCSLQLERKLRELLDKVERLREDNEALAATGHAHGREVLEKSLELDDLRTELATLRRKVAAADRLAMMVRTGQPETIRDALTAWQEANK